MEHQIELGVEVLHGKQSNNPLYQLAEEHHLIDNDDSKFRQGCLEGKKTGGGVDDFFKNLCQILT